MRETRLHIDDWYAHTIYYIAMDVKNKVCTLSLMG